MVWATPNASHFAALKELESVTHSDRILAIIGGAMVDDGLRLALEGRLRKDDGAMDKLFRVTGPLGNTGPKIDLGYALYMYDKTIRDTLLGLAEIRNLFAHRLDTSFDDAGQRMTEAFAKLSLHKHRNHYPLGDWESPSKNAIGPTVTKRDIFKENLKLCLLCLAFDYKRHMPNSNEPRPGSKITEASP